MIRTIRIWWALRKLCNACHEAEEQNHDHGKQTGHNYCAVVQEQDFLSETSNGNKKKRAIYADFLSLAENKMKLLSISEKIAKCKNCGKEVPIKFIRLNDNGLDFLGLVDLVEYILIKYKLTWTLVILPIVAFALGAYIEDLLKLLK